MNYTIRNESDSIAIEKMISSNNEHILFYWNELSDIEKDSLVHTIHSIDLELVEKYFNVMNDQENNNNSVYTPAQSLSIDERNTTYKHAGINALQSGEVAFLTVAGGQASRLGFEQPKGCFGISPIKKHSLFRIFAEKILFYSNHYKQSFQWYIMTSEDNYTDTINFFITHNYFGLKTDNVHFFKQGMLPSLTADGRLILKNKSTIFMNPDGHGGILTALNKSGLTDSMIENKIKYLSYFQVDNPVLNMADPYFIGYHILNQSQVTTKVIKKAYPDEKLGTIVKDTVTGTHQIIEYSDMTPEMMNEKDNSGRIKYLMGSIGIHIFNVNFIKEITKRLPVHCANKKINGIDFTVDIPSETSLSATKFETFVFDTIPFAHNATFFETLRTEEFFPLKNTTGLDSIETTIEGQIKLYQSWLKDNGFTVNDTAIIEISPLFAPDREFFNNEVNLKKADIVKVINLSEAADGKIYIN
ncbi:MAG: hypothetical protein A2015_00185 [Spirochaetes bacterium GWF1_31_7]|nr:MAG: hypothetical protein A2Y30_04325 [Spirochaetes bacterium GWE1_32_154]OHD45590.1 MAG: hypothetical protein A2Y29_10380 [Spirochaetes bacterium GWE2_31_10]OHD51008.1 MAG: hypothetical protein A2015_00185 [Spirochaetes bacterium GWF1_31_7]HBD94323.1 UDP-N-acetylhexosamine pyrophosphorylase [Spirochaetia bacterium]HBI37922.1 UDP-N-acetylhexosamine pyrophosphorylase [Spirochaetia bacterium]